MQNKESLTRRQLHALPFLISYPTIELAAKQSGVSAKQIFDWLNQPNFRQELENRKNEAVNQAVDRLKLYPNNLKNRFLTSSGLPQNFRSHSRLAARQWSFAPNKNSEDPPCQNPDSSSCLGITASKACDTLIRLLDNAQSDSIKHRVAVDMLNMTLKFMEFKDMEQRLRKLEETIAN